MVNVKNDDQMCVPRDKRDLNAPVPLVKLPNNFQGTFPLDLFFFFFYTVLKKTELRFTCYRSVNRNITQGGLCEINRHCNYYLQIIKDI